jgi:hypothetical protein
MPDATPTRAKKTASAWGGLRPHWGFSEMCREQPARFRFAPNGPIFAEGQGTGPLAAGCKSHLTGAITFPPPHMLTRGRWRHDLEILTTVRLSKRGARGVTRSSVRGRSPKLPSGRHPLVNLLEALAVRHLYFGRSHAHFANQP